MVEELIQRVFSTRNAAHQAHWRTKIYAQHKALGKFYEELVGALDAFVEAYMGAKGDVVSSFSVPELKQPKDILSHISEEANWLEENRDEICGGVSALENLLDTITDLHLSTMYKLKQLS